MALFAACLFAVERLQPIEVARFRSFAEGIVFDYDGYAYVSHGRFISRISSDGKKTVWAQTGAPNGHKILADGTHLVCDASHHAVLHLDAHGNIIGNASTECDGKPLTMPASLTLDPKGGFYFTDSGGSREEPVGAIYFVDPQGKTHLAARELRLPAGIVLRPDGKMLLVSESQRNRVLSFDVRGPGNLGPMKVFATLPFKQSGQIHNRPAGLCLDQHGNLYVAHYGMGMVEVLSRKARLIRQYPAGLLTPGDVAFGGPRIDQLFIAGAFHVEGQSDGALVRLDLRPEKGVPLSPAQKLP